MIDRETLDKIMDDAFARGQEWLDGKEEREKRERLRDTFAAAALTGLLYHNHEPPKPVSWWVEQAYDYADAMLRERERTTNKAAPAAGGSKVPAMPEMLRCCEATHENVSASGAGNTPMLTDEEREAIQRAAAWMARAAESRGDIQSAWYLVDDAATLRSLLERLK